MRKQILHEKCNYDNEMKVKKRKDKKKKKTKQREREREVIFKLFF